MCIREQDGCFQVIETKIINKNTCEIITSKFDNDIVDAFHFSHQ